MRMTCSTFRSTLFVIMTLSLTQGLVYANDSTEGAQPSLGSLLQKQEAARADHKKAVEKQKEANALEKEISAKISDYDKQYEAALTTCAQQPGKSRVKCTEEAKEAYLALIGENLTRANRDIVEKLCEKITQERRSQAQALLIFCGCLLAVGIVGT